MQNFGARLAAFVTLLAAGSSAASAAEVPLSRDSFDRALAEGRSSRFAADAGPRFATRTLLWRDLPFGLLGAALDTETSTRWVDVYLETPYTRARWAAFRARAGGALDVEGLWERLGSQSTVTLWVRSVEEVQQRATRDRECYEAQERRGPVVTAARLDIGGGDASRRVESLESAGSPSSAPAACTAGEDSAGCYSFAFPASAFTTGERLRAVLRLEGFDEPLVVRLGRRALRRP